MATDYREFTNWLCLPMDFLDDLFRSYGTAIQSITKHFGVLNFLTCVGFYFISAFDLLTFRKLKLVCMII